MAESLADIQSAGETSAPLEMKRNEKILNIGSRIDIHDLRARVKRIANWLRKKYEVRVMINGVGEGDIQRSERIYEVIKEGLSDMQDMPKIVQKKQRCSSIKFSILPSTESSSKNSLQ